MSDFVLKYADARGAVHSQTAQGTSAQEIRERYTQQGFLVYSVKPKGAGLSLSGEIAIPGRRRKLNLEKFPIFNQQFVTLIRAGLPILKALDLLASAKTKLYAARLQRPTPFVDKTVYVNWNAMCVSAYLQAAQALGLDEARKFALRSLDRVLAEVPAPEVELARPPAR